MGVLGTVVMQWDNQQSFDPKNEFLDCEARFGCVVRRTNWSTSELLQVTEYYA